jgi:hypothetical protein
MADLALKLGRTGLLEPANADRTALNALEGRYLNTRNAPNMIAAKTNNSKVHHRIWNKKIGRNIMKYPSSMKNDGFLIVSRHLMVRP